MIQSVDRAIRMLLELQGARNLSLSELAARLDLSPSTCHGLIRTLVDHDIVRQDRQTQRYHLGPAVLRLAGVYLEALDIRSRALHWSHELSAKTGCSARVGVLSGREVIVVHHEPAPGQQPQMFELGIALPAHSSSLGKAILAVDDFASEDWPSELSPMTSATITRLDGLTAELKTVADDGVAYEREESVIGESSVAAPIYGPADRVVGAIGVVVEGDRADRLEELANPVLDVARAISRDLGAPSSRRRS